MRKVLFFTTLLAFIFASSVWAADITGTWILKYSGQGGERTLDMVIKADGENLTVTTKHPTLGDMAGTGTLKGDAITMTLTSTGERKVGFELKGTVTDNKMAGTREIKRPNGDSGGARGDAPGGDSGGERGGAPSRDSGGGRGGAQGGDSGGASHQPASNAWTAEKK